METTAAQLIIYTKPSGCFGCKKTKELFAAADVEFEEVDVTRYPDAASYLTEELGYLQVPVVLYISQGTENHWSGLDPEKIARTAALYKSEHK